jgi:phosphate transport system substrate-binding protein
MSAQNPSGTLSAGTSGGSPPTESLSTPGSIHRKARGVSVGLAVALAVVLCLVGIGGGYALESALAKSPSPLLLTETGSTLLYPLFVSWSPAYTSFDSHVTLSVVASGSGAGQSGAEDASFNIGASDAYLNHSAQTQYGVVNVPVAVSSQLVFYYLPGVNYHLNLNGSVLAQIYDQTITTWTNPLIEAAQNATVDHELNTSSYTGAPAITLLKRSDSSGDTFIFSSYLYQSYSGYKYSVNTSALGGLKSTAGSTVVSESGNSGMVNGIKGTPGGIAYIGISYLSDLTGVSGVSYAALGDNESLTASGGTNASNYILWSTTNVMSDVSLALQNLNFAGDGLAISLILGGVSNTLVTSANLGKGGSNATAEYPHPYPICNLEYALIKTAPSGSTVSSEKLAATVAFLEWGISLGNAGTYLNPIGFVPLTQTVLYYDLLTLESVAV